MPNTYTNHNGLWDEICKAQGDDVAPGSPLSRYWGSPAYAGTTGGHRPYGYRHLHEIMPLSPKDRQTVARAIFSAAMARHCVYSGEGSKQRHVGYDFAQRPLGWTPELPNDAAPYVDNFVYEGVTYPITMPGGGTWWTWNGEKVEYKNLDEQHCWSFLFDLLNFREAEMRVPYFPQIPGYETIETAVLAQGRLSAETAGIVGMSRRYMTIQTGVTLASDRLYARLTDWMVRAWMSGCMPGDGSVAGDDATQALEFIKVVAKFYSIAPGVALNNKGASPDVVYFQPVFMSWAAAAQADAAVAVDRAFDVSASNGWHRPDLKVLAAQLRDNAKRLGRWAAETLYPNGKMPSNVYLMADVIAGVNGRPVDSLQPYFDSGHAVRGDDGNDYSAWGWRGMRCAGDLGEAKAKAAAEVGLANWQGDSNQWQWLVNSDFTYAVHAAAVAAGEAT